MRQPRGVDRVRGDDVGARGEISRQDRLVAIGRQVGHHPAGPRPARRSLRGGGGGPLAGIARSAAHLGTETPGARGRRGRPRAVAGVARLMGDGAAQGGDRAIGEKVHTMLGPGRGRARSGDGRGIRTEIPLQAGHPRGGHHTPGRRVAHEGPHPVRIPDHHRRDDRGREILPHPRHRCAGDSWRRDPGRRRGMLPEDIRAHHQRGRRGNHHLAQDDRRRGGTGRVERHDLGGHGGIHVGRRADARRHVRGGGSAPADHLSTRPRTSWAARTSTATPKSGPCS